MSRGKRKAAPELAVDEAAGIAPEIAGDERRGGGEGGGAPEQPSRKTWAEVSAILKAAEAPMVPVCQVYVPDPPVEVWHGDFGGAKVYKGDWYAILANGKRIEL